MSDFNKNNLKTLQDRAAWVLSEINDTIPVIAQKLGVNKNTISAYKKGKGDLKGVVIENLVKAYKIIPEWILTGEGPIYKSTNSEPNHQSPGSEKKIKIDPDSDDQPSITELITKTIEILESKTVYGSALSANIQAFHEATGAEQRFRELQASINKMEGRITAVETENNKLRGQIKNIPEDCGGMVANEG